jgi:ribulose-bisphosphate carboxylase large chain
MDSERIRATYLIETAYPVEHAAAVVAGEQSSGTFVKLPGETDALQERHGARIEGMRELDEVDAPSLPGSRSPRDGAGYRRAEVTFSIPLENVGASLPALLATVTGNIYDVARDFLMGHINIALAVAFDEIDWKFSAGAKMAIAEAKRDMYQPDWKKVFEPESLRRSVGNITG